MLVNSYLTCERLANVYGGPTTNKNTRSVHVICVTLNKMADGRSEDERATFHFIKEFEVQNCPDLWDVSSAADKAIRSMGQISTDTTVSSKPFYYSSAFCFFSDQDISGNSS